MCVSCSLYHIVRMEGYKLNSDCEKEHVYNISVSVYNINSSYLNMLLYASENNHKVYETKCTDLMGGWLPWPLP